jgi:hypothetical protein
MFSRRIRVEYEQGPMCLPAPLKWLDSFAMRSFTNDPVFDDTLPLADGLIEAGTRVLLSLLKERMEDWFRRKSYLPKDRSLLLREESPPSSESAPH